MNSQFEIESNEQFQSTIDTLGVELLIDSANIGSYFVFATNDFYPLYYNFDTNDYMIFHGKLKIRSDITCIDISDNKKYVVTGHVNGMISLWSTSDNFSFLKSFQKMHTDKTAITHVKFGQSSEIIYVGDEKGIVTQVSITLIIKSYTFREVLIYDGSNVKKEYEDDNKPGKPKLTSIVVSREGDPFPIGFLTYENYYVTFDPSAITRFNFGASDKQLVLSVSQKLLNRPSISLFSRAIDYFMNIAIGHSIQMLQIRNPTDTIPLLSEIKFKDKLIVNTLFLSSSLIALLLSNGEIQLMLYNGDIVSQNASEQLSQILSGNVINLSCTNEKVCIVNQKNVYWVTFANWETTIQSMAKQGKYDAAFKSLSEINLDLSCNLIGVPQNLAIRHRKICELSRKLVLQYINEDDAQNQNFEDLVNKMANVTVNVITLDLTSIVTESIYPLFVSKHKEKEFFEGIKQAGEKHFVLLCTPDFVSSFLEFYSSSPSSLKECEDYLIKLEFQNSQVPPLVKIAAKYKLLKLIRLFYLDYLHDCVTPCIFYYEDGKIIDYIDFIFEQNKDENEQLQTIQAGNEQNSNRINQNSSNEQKNLELASSGQISLSRSKYFMSEKRMKVRQAAVIVWLLIPEESNGKMQYLRFHEFCRADWPKSLSYVPIFANLITSIKIRYSFTETLEIETFVDAILQTIDQEPYERAEPFLKEIMPYVCKHHVRVGNFSLRHLLTWIFESNGCSIDRENALHLVVKSHPELIPTDTLIKLCERSSFVTFLKDHFVPKKAYSRVVEAMILNVEYRPFIIDFLKDRLNEGNNPELSANEMNEIKQSVKTAVYKSCQSLLLIDQEKFVLFIYENFTQKELNDLIDLLRPPEKLIFLLRLREVFNGELSDDLKMTTFELLLRFQPSQAEHFLTENIVDLDIEKAKELSIKYNRIDCQVSIKIYLHQYNEATQQVGSQIEKNLLDFIESGSDENPSNIDELAEMKDMKSCMEIIDTSIYLLTTISKDSNNKMAFQKGYFCFLFPMYLAQKTGRENIKQSVTLMFSYFVVGSMNIISPQHAFLIISIHFSHLDNDMYKLILQNVSARINYQKRLLRNLDDMLIDDCLQLIEKVYLKCTKGVTVSDLYCCVCKGKVDAAKYGSWYIYPCGHICHIDCYKTVIESIVARKTKKKKKENENQNKNQNQNENKNDDGGPVDVDLVQKFIKNEPNRCPACFFAQESQSQTLEDSLRNDDVAQTKLTTREVKRIQRRLQFALKKNFGGTNDVFSTLNSAYFSKAPNLPSFDNEPEIEVNDTLPPTDDCLIVIKKQ